MKNFKNISKGLVARIGAVCILSVMLSSCLKDHTSNTPLPAVSVMSVVQASPGQPVLDFYLDGTRVNGSGLALGNNLDYFRAYSGKRTASFSQTGTSTQIFSDTVNLKENIAYSLCLVGKTPTLSYLLLTDSLSQPASGSAYLRFVNLSPDAPAVDLAVKDASVIAANKGFKGFTSFFSITGKTYSFEIRQAGTSTVLATLNNVNIGNGYVYTIYLEGLVASSGTDKLTPVLVTNAHP
ncbi:DUF4397 domain-containing protein [Mucilaginibacter sp. BJC16-A38]|uniref:DUF4397 domain-containing protein n=1 Tax=Mucilaginibacter phenanthrenivorans TaxID=1234842 RepID=UPI00215731E7|nr:DUF4397 domain-containing protein [Mucilaginibacter phenanthrenivorans]MCR8560077.1 DUF4397 domain-containing protein [Mucilaginibacter phenanthrenivorans]